MAPEDGNRKELGEVCNQAGGGPLDPRDCLDQLDHQFAHLIGIDIHDGCDDVVWTGDRIDVDDFPGVAVFGSFDDLPGDCQGLTDFDLDENVCLNHLSPLIPRGGICYAWNFFLAGVKNKFYSLLQLLSVVNVKKT
ncbi:MAG: hypothetical protein Q7T54_03175 [Candidatus Levybacteria bacterium]|nr:hypothetical protein [Candidatus Levybacteria bacterium]